MQPPSLPILLNRLESQQRTERFVREQIQKTIGPLPHLANPLLQFTEERLPTYRQTALVQHDPLQLCSDETAQEQAPLPRCKPVAGVEGHARQRDGRSPEQHGLLHARLRRLVRHRACLAGPTAALRTAERNDRPTVVLAGPDDVDLVTTLRPVL